MSPIEKRFLDREGAVLRLRKEELSIVRRRVGAPEYMKMTGVRFLNTGAGSLFRQTREELASSLSRLKRIGMRENESFSLSIPDGIVPRQVRFVVLRAEEEWRYRVGFPSSKMLNTRLECAGSAEAVAYRLMQLLCLPEKVIIPVIAGGRELVAIYRSGADEFEISELQANKREGQTIVSLRNFESGQGGEESFRGTAGIFVIWLP